MTPLWTDLRFALRALRKGRLVTALVVLSLALAIAGNVTVFGLVRAIVFQPLPYPDPEQIVFLGERDKDQPKSALASLANLMDWRERNQSFTDLAGFRVAHMSLGDGERREPLVAAQITSSFFELLGAQALVGRLMGEEEYRTGAHPVVLLSQDFWERRFGDQDEAIGKTLVLDQESYSVVGVLPRLFDFPFYTPVDVWLPLSLEQGRVSRDERETFVVGRLQRGVTTAQAREEMSEVHRRLAEEYPEANRGIVVDVGNLSESFPSPEYKTRLVLLQGAVFFVLLIACVNIANLLLARTEARRREIALRTVLGAGRHRIFRQLLTESFLLAAIGGVGGFALSVVGFRLVSASLAGFPNYWIPVLDVWVLGLTVGLAAFSSLLFGLSPAWSSFETNISRAIKEGARGGGPTRRRFSRALVVVQIALSLVLLTSASLSVKGFVQARYANPGFDMSNLLTVMVSVPNVDDAERKSLTSRLLGSIDGLPEIANAAGTNALPFFLRAGNFSIDEKPHTQDEGGPRATFLTCTPDYLETMGFTLLRGRFFDRGDREEASNVAVLSRAVAERHWPQDDPIGRTVTVEGRTRRIVGIVSDIRLNLFNEGENSLGAVYLPFAQQPASEYTLLMVRSRIDPKRIAASLRENLSLVDPSVSIAWMRTMDEWLDMLFGSENYIRDFLTGFGILAVLLAALGTYGVMAYSVAQRSNEIGVRLALGADAPRILRMVIQQGAVLGIAGLALGVPGVIVVTRILDRVLTYAPPVDPTTVTTVFVVLFSTTLLASWLPARRAARVDPMVVLREE
jgi:putative ABC transport system permease protein